MIKTTNDPEQPKVLWTLAYTLDEAAHPTPGHNYTSDDSSKRVVVLPERIHDLAFDDTILDNVKHAWETILGERSAEYDFLRFEERKEENDDE